jgi:hypothetical protein
MIRCPSRKEAGVRLDGGSIVWHNCRLPPRHNGPHVCVCNRATWKYSPGEWQAISGWCWAQLPDLVQELEEAMSR